jgi:hypothetical protein
MDDNPRNGKLEPGWLLKSMRECQRSVKMMGGTELHQQVAHARKQANKVAKLQKQLREQRAAMKAIGDLLKRETDSEDNVDWDVIVKVRDWLYEEAKRK